MDTADIEVQGKRLALSSMPGRFLFPKVPGRRYSQPLGLNLSLQCCPDPRTKIYLFLLSNKGSKPSFQT